MKIVNSNTYHGLDKNKKLSYNTKRDYYSLFV